jgi:glutamate-1-semialdehyde 2,1-aminomutase
MTVDTPTGNRTRDADHALRERAKHVVPNGMYGHLSVNRLPPEYPQYYARGEGARVWDVDGNEYVDLMCSFGPNILGHHHPKVMAAARAQLDAGDTLAGPGPVLVELAELLVERIAGTTWAMYAKNGTDATHLAVTIAKAQTGRTKVLQATGAYHGVAPWCWIPGEMDRHDHAHMRYFTFNDLASIDAAVAEADGDDVAAIIVSPFRHDAGFDQELTDPDFARGVREICDRIGALLIIDEVRGGFRLHHGGSWEPFGVTPDLAAWSKGIANGFALAAVTGNDAARDGAGRIFATGSFWFQAVPMAAAIATIHALRDEDGVGTMVRMGTKLRDGFAAQASSHGVGIRSTGPVQMPNLAFDGDTTAYERAMLFASECARRGLIVHPRHNWFLCAAHDDDDIDRALAISDEAFAAVRRDFGAS